MSFYTGKYNGKELCHITKGQHDITVMRGIPFSNTVFHTDIKYVDYVVEPLGASDGYVVYNQDSTKAYYYYMSQAIKDKISAGYSFFIYDESTNRYAYEGCLIESSGYRSVSDMCQLVDFYTDTTSRASEDINTQRVYCKKNTSNFVFIFYGIHYNGNVQSIFSQNRTGDIRINRTTFNVGGYDVLNFPYMNPNVLNAVDKKIYSSDGTMVMQLINSEPKNPGMQLDVDGANTTIKAGGHTVITTNVGSTLIELANSVATYDTPSYTVVVTTGQHKTIEHKCSDTILTVGQSFAIGLYAFGTPSMRILKYKEGDMQTIERYTHGPINDPGYQHGIIIYGSGGKVYAKLYAMMSSWADGTYTYRATARNISLNILK